MDRLQWYKGSKPWETDKKDLFISHASEDKDSFVRPLAIALREKGAKIWYDEFELKMGDSLTDSIEKGLCNSKYGLVVLSPVFFEKGWTDFELKSLLMRQINGERVLLPIWHNLNADVLRKRKPYLLDIKSLSSEQPMDQLVENILMVARPDLLNAQLLLNIGTELFKERNQRPTEEVPINRLKIPPERHKTLPFHLVAATRLISEVFWDVMPIDFAEMVSNFARDVDYDQEFIVWMAMASAYVCFVRETGGVAREKKREAFDLLLQFTLTGRLEPTQNLKLLSELEYTQLINSFFEDYKYLISMVKRYN